MKKLALCLLLTFTFVSSALALQDISKEFDTNDVKAAKDAVINVVSSENGARIIQANDYQVIIEFPMNNAAGFLLMNLKTGIQPVSRLYYDFIPSYGRILVKCRMALVENPHTGNELIHWEIGNKNDMAYVKHMLETSASRVAQNNKPAKETKTVGFSCDGNVVTSVEEGGTAAIAGLSVNDKIISVNGTEAGNLVHIPGWTEYLLKKGKAVILQIERDDVQSELKLTPNG